MPSKSHWVIVICLASTYDELPRILSSENTMELQRHSRLLLRDENSVYTLKDSRSSQSRGDKA